MKKTLQEPIKTKSFQIKNRIFMAPLTRSRAPGNIPNDLMAEYYGQRATAGIIVSEGTQVSPRGVGYMNTPGIYSKEQGEGWKKITSAVHAKGGLIFAQIWHVGRVSHPDLIGGQLPLAPSALKFEAKVYTPKGSQQTVIPHAMTIAEIENVIQDFKNGAKVAKEAGFDGVEIHGANGYLPAQFLEDGPNQRTDEYGGSIENRARFILAIVDAAIEVWGGERVCVRISPNNLIHGMFDSNPEKTYLYLAKELEKRKVGFLHVLERLENPAPKLFGKIREVYKGTLVVNGSYNQKLAEEVIESGQADAVAFGTLFIANPDLPQRFAKEAPLNAPDVKTFYSGTEVGYTDYPSLKD